MTNFDAIVRLIQLKDDISRSKTFYDMTRTECTARLIIGRHLTIKLFKCSNFTRF